MIGLTDRKIRAAAAVMLVGAAGCSSNPKRTPPPIITSRLEVTHQVGGTHERTLIRDGVWYQTFGTSLIIVDPGTLAIAGEVSFGKPGSVGPATDAALLDRSLFVIIEDDAVVELSLERPRFPAIVRTRDAAALGIRPRRLSVVDGIAYASGPGGVVRLDDGRSVLSSEDDVGRVTQVGGRLFVCAGRRAYEIPGGAYAGSASELLWLGDDPALSAPLVFARQNAEGALIGLMTTNLREAPGPDAGAAVRGRLRRLRAFDGKVWAVSDAGIVAYTIGDGVMTEALRIEMGGARDVDRIDDNHLAIAGSFGRAIYRLAPDENGPGATFVRAERAPSRLSRSVRDAQHVLAGGDEGAWMYLVGARAELTTAALPAAPPPPREAAALGATAKLADDGRSVSVRGSSSFTHREPFDALIHTVVAIEGDFWLGHDRGITVLRPAQTANPVIDRLRLPGPVRYLHPLLVGGGAAYVSEYGGFGVARYVREATPVDD